MAERVQYVRHKGQKILLIDFTQCTPTEVLKLLPDIQELITSEPAQSVLSLADFTGARIPREVADAIKKTLVFDKPHVKRSALVGVGELPKVFLDAFKSFSRRELPDFKTRGFRPTISSIG